MRIPSALLLLMNVLLIDGCSRSVNECRVPLYNDSTNLAFNNGNFYFPSSQETSECVDRKLLKYFIIDGIRYSEDEVFRYIEFTGGPDEISDTCGWRQAVIDFGQEYLFNRAAVWFLRDSLCIDNYSLQGWNELDRCWITIVQHNGEVINSDTHHCRCPVVFIQDTFQPFRSSKVRFLVNNCRSTFRMTEFEVYYDKPGLLPSCLIKH